MVVLIVIGGNGSDVSGGPGVEVVRVKNHTDLTVEAYQTALIAAREREKEAAAAAEAAENQGELVKQ